MALNLVSLSKIQHKNSLKLLCLLY